MDVCHDREVSRFLWIDRSSVYHNVDDMVLRALDRCSMNIQRVERVPTVQLSLAMFPVSIVDNMAPQLTFFIEEVAEVVLFTAISIVTVRE